MIVVLTCTQDANGVCLGRGPNQSSLKTRSLGNNSKRVQMVSEAVSPQVRETEVTEPQWGGA